MKLAEIFGVKAEFAQDVQAVAAKKDVFPAIPLTSRKGRDGESAPEIDPADAVSVTRIMAEAWDSASAATRQAQDLCPSQPDVAVMDAAQTLSFTAGLLTVVEVHARSADGTRLEAKSAGDVSQVVGMGVVLEEDGEDIETLQRIAGEVRRGKRIDSETASLYVFAVRNLVAKLTGLRFVHERFGSSS